MNQTTAIEIKKALAKKHGNREFFITECKNGPTGVAAGQLLQLDGVAIFKSWSNPEIRGYEIKISRSDFQRDAKYSQYMQYCHTFYFVTPAGMVQRQEVEENIGLIWYNPKTETLTTKKKAIWRKIEVDANMLLYIIMNRLDSERIPFYSNKTEYFKDWLDQKMSNKELGCYVKSKLLEEIERFENEVKKIKSFEGESEKLEDIYKVMGAHGIYTYGEPAEALEKALSKGYPKELDRIREDVQGVVARIDKLKFRLAKIVEKEKLVNHENRT